MTQRNDPVEENLGLAHACARRFIGKGIDYEDLYAAACLGLVKAVNRFDENLGYRFSTYAVPVILGEIKLLFREGGSVKLSRSLKELSLKARAAEDAYRAQTGEEIRMETLAEQLGVDVYQAQEALNASRPPLSLSHENEDGERTLDVPVESNEEALTDRLSLRQALCELDDGDRRLIELRYFRHKTQTDTAKLLGTTQVQISRREKRILTKLRAMLI